jgi:hypothetical protein
LDDIKLDALIGPDPPEDAHAYPIGRVREALSAIHAAPLPAGPEPLPVNHLDASAAWWTRFGPDAPA